ncbi:MAG: Rid family detoxifying hydrolase [Proteobacteria bacterium]|nr:Rid family detoxifying hydrolase [Pseudomonadota bacterium]MBU1697545.1 Rid family detoxifying hydrolase [Pseudomonadota bacterium]
MKQIFSKKAPAAIGPYCHAIVHKDMVFCSGQLAFDPETMELKGVNIEEQTAQVMKNIETVLSEVGIGLDKIIKATIFLDNIEDFSGMNKVYEKCLAGHKPARSTFEVGRLPKDALIEIECIAVIE